ncbi:GNAT family N-acetyltransferase [Streptacidiphilus sp. PB12-B1b]|uniref:GNAT family N-acetyltransferase n=1 Tax=Streptacidiphilus sp. PB12-B1b TaxID=2705012 RepID=UPI0015FADCD3|nr:GNAT family N-acetyltransferase [Streptacidiphilus sp. PB12-B1b]QMU75258.1 GNAT family N-acetyltransferase [Streptacidiphilus sp. PB12-B1b]
MDIVIRPALASELDAAGDLTAESFIGDGHTARDSANAARLRDGRDRARRAELLVAVDPLSGALLGSVTFAPPGSPYADLAQGQEGEFRMLAVSAEARGRGAGEALVRACIERARERGLPRLVMSTQPAMVRAHRIYERLGFVRTPARDWSPAPGVELMTYALELVQ